jgi:hypothetical protein
VLAFPVYLQVYGRLAIGRPTRPRRRRRLVRMVQNPNQWTGPCAPLARLAAHTTCVAQSPRHTASMRTSQKAEEKSRACGRGPAVRCGRPATCDNVLYGEGSTSNRGALTDLPRHRTCHPLSREYLLKCSARVVHDDAAAAGAGGALWLRRRADRAAAAAVRRRVGRGPG